MWPARARRHDSILPVTNSNQETPRPPYNEWPINKAQIQRGRIFRTLKAGPQQPIQDAIKLAQR